MTLLAGIWGRRPDSPLDDSLCEPLERAISRDPDDRVTVIRRARACLFKVDIGAYGAPAEILDPSGDVSLLCGEPLLEVDGRPADGDRSTHLELLHRGFQAGRTDLLRDTHGAFCAVHCDAAASTLTLVTDKLGIRPIYYWVGPSHIVFATALRILEAHPLVPKTMDLRAVTEIASFGYELENRTPYKDVCSLRPAERLRCGDSFATFDRYWRWDEIAQSERSEPDLLRAVYDEFVKAVARRLGRDRTTVALLSGGLDSRVVVAALHSLGARVHTLNFSFPRSQDQVFAADFAGKIGTLHQELDVEIGRPDFFNVVRQVWTATENRRLWPVERPSLMWTGNDGDVSLGHLWMSSEVVALLRGGRLDDAIDRFLVEQKKRVVSRLLRRDVLPGLSGALHAGMRAELGDFHCQDPGRNLYVFLMINNMRKHLMRNLEHVDLHRVELQVPFCDSGFLVSVLAVPLDPCLYHRFYTKWLYLFEPAVTAVPWQTYPGREPCPLPIPEGLAYQWNPKDFAPRMEAEKRELLRKSSALLAPGGFPDRILDKSYFRLTRLLYRLGLRDYGYVVQAALTYQRYWKACAGRHALPSPS